MSTASDYVTVARTDEIPVGGRKVIRIGDVPLAIFHLEDGWFAIEDVCTHDGGPVAEGELCGHEIECPRHGARFDVRTGAPRRFPATSPVPTYAVRLHGDEIQVERP